MEFRIALLSVLPMAEILLTSHADVFRELNAKVLFPDAGADRMALF